MTASTAEKVLRNRTLRWSHPDKFDDSLDVARTVDEKMDENKQKQVQDAFIDLAADAPVNDNKKTNRSFKRLALMISLSNDRTVTILEAKKNFSIDLSSFITNLNECWKKIRNASRILCLGIEKDNDRLWNDYAEEHKGVVIELACRHDSDSPWLVAEPVEYVNEKDLFLTVKDWAEILCLEHMVAAEYIIKKCSLRKANDTEHKWSEQNEWRIPSFCRHHETGLVSDYGVNQNDFSAVYFGYNMDIETQSTLLSLLDAELAHVSVFRCELDSSQKISFRKLK